MTHNNRTEPTESTKTLHERFNNKPVRAGIASGLALAAVVALSACGPESDAKPTSSPTSQETPAPTATPTPEAPSAELQAMYAETPDQVIARPIQERADFCYDVAATTISLEKLGNAYADISGNDYDRIQAPVSIDNDPQAIVSYTTNMHRLAMTRKDPDLVIKVESCNTINPATDPSFKAIRQSVEDGGFGYPIEAAANSRQLVGSVATSWEEPVDSVDANGQKTRSQVISIKDSNGNTSIANYVFIGGNSPMWTTGPMK